MRQEHVTLQGVEVSQLYDQIRNYLKDKKLDVISEEKEDNFWDLKAHKGTRGSVIILRTGAWGKDIVVPAVIAGVLTAGVGAVVAGGASAYRAHAFERNFWNFVQKTLADIGKGKSTMSEPVTVTP
jgi:hypothetical protein